MRIGKLWVGFLYFVLLWGGIMGMKERFNGSDWVVCLVVFESENVVRVFIYRGVSFF